MSRYSWRLWGWEPAPLALPSHAHRHTHTRVLGRNGLLLYQIIERTDVGQLLGLQGEKRPFPSVLQPDSVSSLFLEMLYCDVS